MKTVVITGVSGGIGSASARLFHHHGWRVFGIDCIAPEDLAGDCNFTMVDLANEAEVARFFASFGARGENIDALVNNAARQICKPVLETTSAEWDEVMAVNLRGAFLTMKYAYPLLQVTGGTIINVGSIHARATSVGIAAYAASKGGLEALTRAAALEFAPAGIRVNGVHPGATSTPMLEAGLARVDANNEVAMKDFAARQLLGRVGKPEEIAESILFLADNQRAGFITGSFLVADGGALCRLSTET